jgi:hypothetical protein
MERRLYKRNSMEIISRIALIFSFLLIANLIFLIETLRDLELYNNSFAFSKEYNSIAKLNDLFAYQNHCARYFSNQQIAK